LNLSAQSAAVVRLFSDGTRYANAGRFDKALTSYKTALFTAENEYLEKGYLARLHYNLGVCHFQLEQFDLAANQFKLAIVLKTDYARAHYALGMAESKRRNWKAATAEFERTIKDEPSNGEAWFDLAFAKLMQNDLAMSERSFVRSIEFGSVDSALSHNNIGVILAMKGDLDGAEKEFERAIDLSGNDLPEAKRNLVFCRTMRAGKPDLIARELEYVARTAAIGLG